MITIEQFCDKHNACRKGRDWALAQGVTTMSEIWQLNMRPDWRIWIATRPGVLDDKTLRLAVRGAASAVMAAARGAAEEDLANWLINNTTPNFEGVQP